MMFDGFNSLTEANLLRFSLLLLRLTSTSNLLWHGKSEKNVKFMAPSDVSCRDVIWQCAERAKAQLTQAPLLCGAIKNFMALALRFL